MLILLHMNMGTPILRIYEVYIYWMDQFEVGVIVIPATQYEAFKRRKIVPAIQFNGM
jgi:hypothetical protein